MDKRDQIHGPILAFLLFREVALALLGETTAKIGLHYNLMKKTSSMSGLRGEAARWLVTRSGFRIARVCLPHVADV